VLANRVVRKIFGPKRNEMTGEWKRLCNEKLYDVYSSPNIIRLIKSRRMRWVRHVTRIEKREVHAGFLWRDLREGDRLEDLGEDGRTILK
jgi:hypothetical protein